MLAIICPICVVDQIIPWNRSHNFHRAFTNQIDTGFGYEYISGEHSDKSRVQIRFYVQECYC